MDRAAPHLHRLPRLLATCVLTLAPACSGCIHPNIPSYRQGDSAAGIPPSGPAPPSFTAAEVPCADGAPAEQAARADAVPWPRFHPLPTRPVLGPPL